MATDWKYCPTCALLLRPTDPDYCERCEARGVVATVAPRPVLTPTAPANRETVCTKLHQVLDAHGMRGVWLPTVRLSRAKEGSRNPGALYVKDVHGNYFGKIAADGRPFWVEQLTTEMKAELRDFATEGVEYLARVGRETGQCCFCGRELTDPESVGLGYGPVCAKQYGLPHNNRHGF